MKIPFEAIDKWFEEDTEIYIHPKDPFKRVDVLQSSRHILVRIAGQLVAETNFSMHLYETGLPARYYMPLTAIDPQVLRPSATKTGCPYKGEAEYHHVEVNGEVHEDVVWFYTRPMLECAKIEGTTLLCWNSPFVRTRFTMLMMPAGLCCFYNEKVSIEIDGEILDSPVTPFTNRKPNDKPSFL